jgi:hypothetical protein
MYRVYPACVNRYGFPFFAFPLDAPIILVIDSFPCPPLISIQTAASLYCCVFAAYVLCFLSSIWKKIPAKKRQIALAEPPLAVIEYLCGVY